MELSIPVLLGTSRIGNQSQKVARYLHSRLSALEGINSPYLDLGDTRFPVMLERLDHTEAPPADLPEWHQVLSKADGLLIVAPEYKNGYPAALKNLLDYMPAQVFRYKPIGISTVSAGAFGGVQCLSQLRLLCLACGGLPIPDRFPVPLVREAFDENGAPKQPDFAQKADIFIGELVKYVKVLVQI